MENEETITVMELVEAGGHGISPQCISRAFRMGGVNKYVKWSPKRVMYDRASACQKIADMYGNARATNYVVRDSKAEVYAKILTSIFGYTADQLEAIVPLTTVGKSKE